jgi:hypothetical protein
MKQAEKCGWAELAQIKTRVPHLWLLMLIGLAAGCNKSGQDIAPVTGRVTLDGKPLQFAVVTFHPEGKSTASSTTDKEGRYELLYKRGVLGAPVGMSRVSILLDVEQAHRPQLSPQADLKREVKPGPNTIDFELKSDTN